MNTTTPRTLFTTTARVTHGHNGNNWITEASSL